MITGISHATIHAKDIDATVSFYTNILGLSEAFRQFKEDGSVRCVGIRVAPRQFIEIFAGGTVEGHFEPRSTGR
ncbi:MAG: VOC family protein, partial [Oscillospiraceae bacterium]|nr:VOC family protein [Oscillospiraceae bacterium]